MSSDAATCPFCASPDVETVAAWGGQLITQQMRCRACNTHFEALREAFADRAAEDLSPWTSS
jgi:transposase-like protein